MSQCYRVQLKASITRCVEAEDSLSYPLELTRLLPDADMRDLLKEALLKQGWVAEAQNDAVFRKTGPGGEELLLDLETMTVTARLERKSEVCTELEVDGSGNSKAQANRVAKELLQQQQAAAGDKIAEAGARTLRREVKEALLAGEEARRGELHGLLQQVYAEALKRKAGQLGTIMEVWESTNAEGNYELSIQIET